MRIGANDDLSKVEKSVEVVYWREWISRPRGWISVEWDVVQALNLVVEVVWSQRADELLPIVCVPRDY